MSERRIDAILMLKDKMTAPLKNAVNKLESSQKQVKSFGTSMQKGGKTMTTVGKGMTKALTVPIVGALGASGKLAADFQESMAKVSTIADKSFPMKKMQKQILSLSNETGVSASKIANNVYDAISAGQKTGDAVKFVGNATKLAKAGFTDTNSALDILTTTLNAYGLKAKDAGKVSDMLITTQNLGKVTVGELSSSMGKLIPTANAYHVSLKDVDAGYITLTKNGIKAKSATTYMNSMFNELGKSGTTVSKTLKQATGKDFAGLMKSGKSVDQVLEILKKQCDKTGTKFSDLWKNTNSSKAANSILSHSKDFKKGLQALEKSAGTTESAYKKMERTAPAQFNKSVNRIKNSGILLGQSLGATLAPVLNSLSKTIKNLTEAFAKLSPGQRRIIVNVLLMVAAIGPAILVAGKLTMTIGNMAVMFSKAAKLGGIMGKLNIFMVIATAVALVAVLVITHWDKVGPVFKKIGSVVVGAIKGIINVVKTVASAIKSVVNFIISIPSKIKGALGWIGKHAGSLISGGNSTLTIKKANNAQGTPYWRGGLTSINERGGEILDLPTGTRIIPHDVSVEMMRAQARGSGGRTNIINIPKLADKFVVREDADVDRIADALAARLEKLRGDLV